MGVQCEESVIRPSGGACCDDQSYLFGIAGRACAAPGKAVEVMSALPLQNQHHSNDSSADPSMEEILASIRRIIADDHGAPITPRQPRHAGPPVIEGAARPALSPAASARANAPGFEADYANAPAPPRQAPARGAYQPREAGPYRERTSPDHSARVDSAPREWQSLRQPHDEPPQARSERPARPDASPRPAEQRRHDTAAGAQPAPPPPAPRRVEAARSGDMEPLLSPVAQASVTSAFGALTASMQAQNPSIVEEAVRDMLRPMLKEWLDQNLPTIVERLVRAEIERVARGGNS